MPNIGRIVSIFDHLQFLAGEMIFVTAGDDFPDLPMLFPEDFITTLVEGELRVTFAAEIIAKQVNAHHAGSILSPETTNAMNDAVRTIRKKGNLVQATLLGLPGVLQKTLGLLEQRLGVYSTRIRSDFPVK